MSALAATPSSTLQSVLDAISRMNREEKQALVKSVQEQLIESEEEEFPQWQMDIVEERLRRLDAGLDKAIPLEEAFAELDRKWASKS